MIVKNVKKLKIIPFVLLVFYASLYATEGPDIEPPAKVLTNQLGYHPDGVKLAIITDLSAQSVELVNHDGETVHTGQLSTAEYWPHSDEKVRIYDFSDHRTNGIFRVRTNLGDESYEFRVDESTFSDIGLAALRSFYLIRSAT